MNSSAKASILTLFIFAFSHAAMCAEHSNTDVAQTSEKSVAPSIAAQAHAILQTHCLECHGGKATKHDLDLKTRESLLRGGETRPAIVPGKANESLLFKK